LNSSNDRKNEEEGPDRRLYALNDNITNRPQAMCSRKYDLNDNQNNREDRESKLNGDSSAAAIVSQAQASCWKPYFTAVSTLSLKSKSPLYLSTAYSAMPAEAVNMSRQIS
jgi:hypothetical protein